MNAGQQIATRAAETTAENPWPLRLLTTNIRKYIDRMSEMWVEGQVVDYKQRGGTRMAFFTLRDVEQDVSMTVTAFPGVLHAAGEGFDEGARIVAQVKPSFYEQRGTLSLRASKVKLQGIGSLLAQIERLRASLAAEGLFNVERKKPLPFLPRRVGLICGRAAKAQDDVVVNARLRWPTVEFEIREVLVQGQHSAQQVSAAIAELDAAEQVDVIVVARGGGSVEDLLPFSSEQLVRAAAACSTPLVSAIGHEGDAPLLDLVADYRASTPTDAARRVVPDYREELQKVRSTQATLRALIRRRLTREAEVLSLLTTRPVLQRPTATIDQQRSGLEQAVSRARMAVRRQIEADLQDTAGMSGTLRALSPLKTLERGYAIVRDPSGSVVTAAAGLQSGSLLETMVAQGTFVSQVVGANALGSFIHPVRAESSVGESNE